MDVVGSLVGSVVPDALAEGVGDSPGAANPLAYTTGMVLRLVADADNITLNGSDVSGWADTSGSANAHNFAQATAGNQPPYNSVPLGSNATVDLAASKYLTTPAHADFAVGSNSWLWWGLVRRPAFATHFTMLFTCSNNGAADGIRIGTNPSGVSFIFWGSDVQSYGAAGASIPADTPILLVAGIDASASQRIYKIGANAIQRTSITVSGTGASTVPVRLHGDGGNSLYDDDRVHIREMAFHSYGAATAIANADIDAIAAYAAQFGVAT